MTTRAGTSRGRRVLEEIGVSEEARNRGGTMKAIVQDRYGSADVLHLREIDKPVLADDRVLIRVRAASVNALDWHSLRLPLVIRLAMRSGVRRPKVPVPGVDVAGVVERVGKDVTRFKPGDEVFGQAPGTFAEYATPREDRLVPKPRRVSFEQAAAVPVAGCTALQGLRDKGNLRPGQRVLIYGAGGGVGTFAVQIAKALGAHVTAATSAGNVDLIRSIGADEVLDYAKEDFTRRGQLYDVFFDLGGTRSLGDCRRALHPDGTYLQVGAARHPLRRLIKVLLLSRLTRQRLVFFIAKIPQADLVFLADLMEAGKLTPVIDRQYPLSGVPDAIRYIGTGRARGKVVISVT